MTVRFFGMVHLDHGTRIPALRHKSDWGKSPLGTVGSRSRCWQCRSRLKKECSGSDYAIFAPCGRRHRRRTQPRPGRTPKWRPSLNPEHTARLVQHSKRASYRMRAAARCFSRSARAGALFAPRLSSILRKPLRDYDQCRSGSRYENMHKRIAPSRPQLRRRRGAPCYIFEGVWWQTREIPQVLPFLQALGLCNGGLSLSHRTFRTADDLQYWLQRIPKFRKVNGH